jgi:hypothetical protein
MSDSPARQPILVTGIHRSGTTWAGKMLAAGGGLAYISEPLNVWRRPGVMRAPVEHWYQYLSRSNEEEYLQPFSETLALQYHLMREIASLRSLKDLIRMGRDAFIFTRGRLLHQRPLLKDPFAVFSAPWFASRLDCRVVVLVRHPAAFISSLQRLGWTFNFRHLLDQPLLMQDLLEEFRPQMEQADAAPHDLINRAALLWSLIYRVVDRYRRQYPEFIVVRHEDLSLAPLSGFEALYRALRLEFNARARRRIMQATAAANPSETSTQRRHAVKLDSRANIKNWQKRLSTREIARIRQLTDEVASLFYSDQDWQ